MISGDIRLQVGEAAVGDLRDECENALLLPHLGSATRETRTAMGVTAVENVIAMLDGQRPPNCVNPEVLG